MFRSGTKGKGNGEGEGKNYLSLSKDEGIDLSAMLKLESTFNSGVFEVF